MRGTDDHISIPVAVDVAGRATDRPIQAPLWLLSHVQAGVAANPAGEPR